MAEILTIRRKTLYNQLINQDENVKSYNETGTDGRRMDNRRSEKLSAQVSR